MTRARALVRSEAPLAPLEQLVEVAREYAQDSRASSTRKAYLSDFASFEAWCARQGLASAPTTPAAVAVYLASLAERGRKASTIESALAGIAWAQRARGFEWRKGHPAITTVMTGIRRRHGTAPQQKAPVIDEVLASLVATLDDELVGLRDRALLTLGWFGAFRRSELVALTVADVAPVREGLVVTVRRSKSDQEGHGAEKGIPYASAPGMCAVRALAAWLAASGIAAGPLFRPIDQHGHVGAAALSDRSVALIVQRAAERVTALANRISARVTSM